MPGVLETPRIQITLEPAIRQLREDFGLTSRDLAEGNRVSMIQPVPRHGAKDCLEALAALDERLNETFVSWEAARSWLAAPSRYLGDLAPIEAIRAGRTDRVMALVEAIDSGFAS